MHPRPMAALLAALAAALPPGRGAAQAPAGPASAPAPHWADQAKRPVPWFTWGADLRLRNDTAGNPSLTDADPPGARYSFERLRLRGSATFIPAPSVQLVVRLTWEGRHYGSPASKPEWDRSDGIFDALQARIALPGLPVTWVLGRQDLVFGEGWLVSEGTPLDGPRTFFFDAVRATLELVGGTLDLVYLDQRSDPAARIRPFFNAGKALMEQDERGAIAYLVLRPCERARLDAYFIHKHDRAVLPAGDSGDVFTLGGALARDAGAHLSLRLEAAGQLGERKNAAMFPRQDGKLSAWGGNARLSWAFGDPLRSRSTAGFEALSGSAAGDLHAHQFDPLWGRWARYSELFPNELDRPGDRGNVLRAHAGHQLEPLRGMALKLDYHAIWAYANRMAGAPGFGGGRFKGHLVTALLTHAFDRFWSGRLLFEHFTPGGFYAAPPGGGPLEARRDPAFFVRGEVSLSL